MTFSKLDLARDTGPVAPAMKLADLHFEGADVRLRLADGKICGRLVMSAAATFRVVVEETELFAFAKDISVLQ